MRIVVLAGGLSTEREVSISSGTLVAEALRSKGHEVVLLDVFMGYEENICDIDALFKQNYSFTDGNSIGDDVENTITNIKEAKENRLDKTSRYIGRNVIEICAEADITFLALHGGEGENGQLQATLDLFGIKYTGSGYLGSALAMNKGLTKSVFMQKNINTPSGELYKNEKDALAWNMFPCIVKPCSGGSSVGVSKVENADQYKKAVKEALKYEDEIVVEQFVTGREFSVGLIGAGHFRRLRLLLSRECTIMPQNIRQAQQLKPVPQTLTKKPTKSSVMPQQRHTRHFTLKAMHESTFFLTRAVLHTASRQTLSPA